ncbi:MAG: sigma-70 family RNA polymerase sigma factor [Clostridiales bacterium]|nr:sigma-70 family RNA polymerase sigma factor [Clostridiales bacterium]
MDEGLIIKRAQEGDLDAFEEIIGRYKKSVYNLCLRMLYNRNEAEDVAQEAFIKIYKGLRSYNGKSKFSTWVLKITSNACIDFMRKRKMNTVPIEDYRTSYGGIEDTSNSPESSYMAYELKKEVEVAVKSLPEKYRMMIIYYHFMNLSYKEISDILNEPMTIVKNRLYRARFMLRNKLMDREKGYNGLQSNI